MVSTIQRASASGNEPDECPRQLRPLVAALFQQDSKRAIAELERLEMEQLSALAPCAVSRGLLTALRAAGPHLRDAVLSASEAWAREYAPTQASASPPYRLPSWLFEGASLVSDRPHVDPGFNETLRRMTALAELFRSLKDQMLRAEVRALNTDGLSKFAAAKAAAVMTAPPAAIVLQWVMNASDRTYKVDSRYFAARLRDAVSSDPSKVDVDEVARRLTLAAAAWSKRAERVHNFYEKADALLSALGVEGTITRSNVSKWCRDMVVVDPFALRGE